MYINDLNYVLWFMAVIQDEGAEYDYTMPEPADLNDYLSNCTWNDARPKPSESDVLQAQVALEQYFFEKLYDPRTPANSATVEYKIREPLTPADNIPQIAAGLNDNLGLLSIVDIHNRINEDRGVINELAGKVNLIIQQLQDKGLQSE